MGGGCKAWESTPAPEGAATRAQRPPSRPPQQRSVRFLHPSPAERGRGAGGRGPPPNAKEPVLAVFLFRRLLELPDALGEGRVAAIALGLRVDVEALARLLEGEV